MTNETQLAIRAGKLFSGVPDQEVVTNALVLISGNKITEVRADDSNSPLDGYQVIDASQQFVMPGLVNAHVHLEMHRQLGTMHTRYQRPESAIFLTAVENMFVGLAMGVTTVRDLGSIGTTPADLRDKVDAGEIAGPRIQAAIQMISMTGGHGQPLCYEADGVDGMTKAVRLQVKRGADVIKLCASGGVVAAIREDPWNQELSTEEMAAAVLAAHRAGLRVSAHAQPPQAVKAAVIAGVDTIEHGAFLDDEGAEMMRENGTYYIPTMDDSWMAVEFGDELGRPKWIQESAKASLDYRVKAFGRAIDAGVIIGVGTDGASEMGREMHRMVESGFSSAQALVAATHNGAELMGLQDSLGTIEAGKLADLVILDEDPLDDVRVVDSAVSLVVKDGMTYTPSALLAVCANSLPARHVAMVQAARAT